ncbi:hypothetical protein OH76DRAFT_544048 [Lentinus brumalis]|uniref:Uncharacterized protein n=1 Tax=Lentinus brumalis TaxID=2498619 RepID=A0A371D9S6_9APHY|nr:hypothetical protein OH76DRAFT_544048 [Polyporus brumalis]
MLPLRDMMSSRVYSTRLYPPALLASSYDACGSKEVNTVTICSLLLTIYVLRARTADQATLQARALSNLVLEPKCLSDIHKPSCTRSTRLPPLPGSQASKTCKYGVAGCRRVSDGAGAPEAARRSPSVEYSPVPIWLPPAPAPLQLPSRPPHQCRNNTDTGALVFAAFAVCR